LATSVSSSLLARQFLSENNILHLKSELIRD
jgi:hypothetical protein